MKHFDIVLCNCTRPFGQNNREHMGLAYLASSLSKAGYKVKVIDSLLECLSPLEIARCLERFSFRYLGLSFLSYGYLASKELAKLLPSDRDYKIIIGGHFVSFTIKDIISDGFPFDYAILGEGEESFPALLKRLDAGDIPTSKIICSPLKNDLDELTYPARPYAKQLVDRGFPLSLSSSRGCSYNCSFCSVNAFYQKFASKKWRARAAHNVVGEIIHLYNEYNATAFDFIDDNFVGSTKAGMNRAIEIANLLYAHFPNKELSFSFDTRVENICRELIEPWAKVGLKHVLIGVESVNSNDQRIYRKRISGERVKSAKAILDEYGIEYKIGIILWNPESTVETVLENFDYFDEIAYTIQQPLVRVNMYKGTQIYEEYMPITNGNFYDIDWCFLDKRTEEVYRDLLATMKYSQLVLRSIPSSETAEKMVTLNNQLAKDVLLAAHNCLNYDTIIDTYLSMLSELIKRTGGSQDGAAVKM